MIVATGELASSRIVAAAFAEQGLPAVWVDARDVLVTDAEHTVAAPDMDATCRECASQISRRSTARSEIPVLGGFIARDGRRRDDDARTRRVGLFGGDFRGVPRRRRDSDLDGRRRHADGRSAGRAVAAGRAAAVVCRSLRARVFRRQGPPPQPRFSRPSPRTFPFAFSTRGSPQNPGTLITADGASATATWRRWRASAT